MKKFKIKFTHTVEETYECTVEADSKKKALEMFDDDPFGCGEVSDTPIDSQGLDIDVIETIEIKD
jgi:hypothetical protein